MNKIYIGTPHQRNLGMFIGQTRTHIVLGKTKFKIRNKHIPTDHATPTELKCAALKWKEREEEPLTELEQLYYNFCEKAYNIILGNPSLQGEYFPAGINFPDFVYEIIPAKLPIE